MIAGTLEIQLLANMARLQNDMDAAKRSVGGAMGEIEKMAGMAKAALGALGAGLSIAEVSSIVRGAIDAADGLRDLSQKSGIAVESLGGLGFAAGQAGGSLESVGAAAGKLNKSIAESVRGQNDQAAAFKALGINVVDASGKLKTADVVMAEVADEFEKYSDGPEKSAIALTLFGKAGADMIPVLNDGGKSLRENIEYSKQYSNQTKELSAAADEFNDTLGKLKVQQTGFVNSITADVLPTLTRMAKELLAAKEGATGLFDAFGRFFSISGAQSKDPVVAIDEIDKKLESLRKTAAELDGLSPFKKWLEGEDIKVVSAQIAKLETERGMLAKLAKDMAAGSQFSGRSDVASVDSKPPAPRLPGTDSVAKNPLDTAFDSFAAESAKREAILTAEAGGVAKLTETEKWALEVMVKVRDGKLGQSTAERALIGDRVEAVLALEKLNAAEVQSLAVMNAHAAAITSDQAKTQGIMDSTLALRQQSAELGLSSEALIALKQSRIDEQIALENWRLGLIGGTEAEGAQATAIRETIAALQDSKVALAENASAQKAADAIKAQGDLWKSVESTAQQTFSGIFESGASSFERLRTALKNGLYDLLYQMTVKKWIINIAAGVSGTSAAESAFGASAVSGVGGLSGLLGTSGSVGYEATSDTMFSSAGSGILGWLSNIPALATGTDYVPQDMLAQVHKGEKIVPAAYNKPGSDGDKPVTIINQTTGRIDSVQETRLSNGERALILKEAVSATAASLGDPNSGTSRALGRNYSVQRSR